MKILAAIWEVIIAGFEWLAKNFAGIYLVLEKIQNFLGVNIVNVGIRVAIETLVLTAWGVFLGIFTMTIGGYNLITILSTNPLQGLPGGMLCLVCSIFPLSFFIRLTVAYVLWCLTFQAAARVMSKAVRMIFGG